MAGVRLIDKAADVGGTWYWNRYPGIACDVESYVYMPLLEELGYMPTEQYAKGAEILAHCRRIAEHYDLYRDACLQTEVHEIRWEPATSRWIITTNRGDEMRARFVSMANGYIQKPKLPGIPGIESFGGQRSTPAGGTTATPASDWSTCPASASASSAPGRPPSNACRTWPRRREHLSSSSARRHRSTSGPTSPPIRSGRRPSNPVGSSRRIENFQILTAGGQADEDLVADAWTSITKKLPVMRWESDGGPTPNNGREHRTRRLRQDGGDPRAESTPSSSDPATAEALKPWYGYFCKRPCFHDEYLQTFNRDNVTLVDTRGLGVQRIADRG